MFGAADQHHAILIEQAPITLDQHGQIGAILEVEPGAAVSEHISATRRGDAQWRAHATAAFPVAPAFGRLVVGQLPEPKFRRMGTALVTARDKRRVGGCHFLERSHDIGTPGCCRVGFRTNQHKVVVHDFVPPGRVTVRNELLLRRLVVDEQHVSVAPARHVDGLPGSQRHHLHVDATGLLERRQDMAEQAGLLG